MAQRGMTLIEVMVAILLMATALVVIAAAIPSGLITVSTAGLQLTATSLAQEPLDVARRTAFASLPSLASSRAAVPGFAAFDREVTVSDYGPPASCAGTPCSTSCPSDASGPTCRQIQVRVFYRGQLGETVTTLTTVLAR
jgi:prepilin-type N-terminal cleavage/methylation domain-containing protein